MAVVLPPNQAGRCRKTPPKPLVQRHREVIRLTEVPVADIGFVLDIIEGGDEGRRKSPRLKHTKQGASMAATSTICPYSRGREAANQE